MPFMMPIGPASSGLHRTVSVSVGLRQRRGEREEGEREKRLPLFRPPKSRTWSFFAGAPHQLTRWEKAVQESEREKEDRGGTFFGLSSKPKALSRGYTEKKGRLAGLCGGQN